MYFKEAITDTQREMPRPTAKNVIFVFSAPQNGDNRHRETYKPTAKKHDSRMQCSRKGLIISKSHFRKFDSKIIFSLLYFDKGKEKFIKSPIKIFFLILLSILITENFKSYFSTVSKIKLRYKCFLEKKNLLRVHSKLNA